MFSIEQIKLYDNYIFTQEIKENEKIITISCHDDSNECIHIYNYNLVNNVLYPIWCDQKRWDFLNNNIQYNTSDIVLITYPKSGTTWLEQILILMKYGTHTYDKLNPSVRNNFDLSNNIGKIHIEGSVEQTNIVYDSQEIMNNIPLEDFNKIPFRIIKTHAAYETLLCKEQLFTNKNKMIIVTRNPLDSAVSGYYHYNDIQKYAHKKKYNTVLENHISFKNWAMLWLNGKVSFGSWFDWTKKWRDIYLQQLEKEKEKQEEKHIHWIFYEDLKKNPMDELVKLNDFLDCQLSIDELKTIHSMTTFQNMKEQAKTRIVDELNSDIHFRKGIVGDWKNYFNEELLEMYTTKLQAMDIQYTM